jgi:hypothetical protein
LTITKTESSTTTVALARVSRPPPKKSRGTAIMAEDLDRGEDRVEPDRLRDAFEVDQGQNNDEQERGQHLRHIDELREVITAEREREGAGRGDRRAHNGEGDHEAQEGYPEGALDVGRRPSRPGIAPPLRCLHSPPPPIPYGR